MTHAEGGPLRLALNGDWEVGRFLIHSAHLVRGEKRFEIFLTSEQTNMALHHEDSFAPVLGLMNILGDSGHRFQLEISIENGDEEAAAGFLALHGKRFQEPWAGRSEVGINSSVPEAPDQGNIELSSPSGHAFLISTEWFEESTSALMEKLQAMLNEPQN